MTTVIASRDCGNSPKNQLVHALAVAIESSNRRAFGRCISDGITWVYPGCATIVGRVPAIALLASTRKDAPRKIEMAHALSHGRSGAANGTVRFASGKRLRFCHVMEFATAKGEAIAHITSYYEDDTSAPSE